MSVAFVIAARHTLLRNMWFAPTCWVAVVLALGDAAIVASAL